MNQILSNIQKVVDDSVLLFTLKVSEKYDVDQNDLYNIWKEICNDNNENEVADKKPNRRKLKKIPTSKKENSNKSPLEKKSTSALKKLCKECGLKKYSTLKKKDLIELLQKHYQKIADSPAPLEVVLNEVLDDIDNLDIKDCDNQVVNQVVKESDNQVVNKKPDFNEEDIVEEY